MGHLLWMKDDGYGSAYVDCHPFLLVRKGEHRRQRERLDGALVSADIPGLGFCNSAVLLCPGSTHL
jgi:hypothetical protein